MGHLMQHIFFWGAFVILLSQTSALHPWGGLVVDEQGDIYFTFICPFVDDDHFACVWKISNGEATASLQSNRSPSDIVLARNNKRVIFGAERSNAGRGHQASLWELDQGQWDLKIGPTTKETQFHVQAFTVDDADTVYFAKGGQLFSRSPEGAVALVSDEVAFDRIDALAWGPKGALYILDRDVLYLKPEGRGPISEVASGLKEESPEELPFSGANILFDMAVDEEGIMYLAYYGNRRILKVIPSGEVSTLVHSKSPWSPHGIDVYKGEIYILESTVGGGSWWKIWERPVIVPRVRKIGKDGTSTVVFEYKKASR